jgi:hypothetical protein
MLQITLRGLQCNISVLNVHAPTEDKSDDMKDSIYKERGNVSYQFPKYHKIILLDFNAKAEGEDIFKPTIGNENLHEIRNDNGVRAVNFATSENLIVRSVMFLNCNIHKYAWTSDGKKHNQIHHVLIDKRQHSSTVHI